MTALSFHTIADLSDDLLCSWLNLYETAFPPEERILVSTFIRLLQTCKRKEQRSVELLAAVDGERHLVGLAFYEFQLNVNWVTLWYIAIDAAQRSQGYGSQVYQEIVRRSKGEDCDGILFEVEIPENAGSFETRLLAERRIQFYQRNGAKLLSGIHYLQSVGIHQPLTPMHLMFHPLKNLDAQDAFQIAKDIFGDLLTKITGE
jgi:GNAT superfamily N-acetyltransferase